MNARSARSTRKSSRAPQVERRVNRPLREVLEDLLEHARHIARECRGMSQEELNYAQQRLEWLADEVWRAATGGEPPP